MNAKLINFLVTTVTVIQMISLTSTGNISTPDTTETIDYCFMTDKNPYMYFAMKTPYERVRAKTMKHLDDSDCKPIYIWALVRHGARFLNGKYGNMKAKLEDIRDKIVRNHEKKNFSGKLCTEDLNALKQWTYEWPIKMNNELTPQGTAEMEHLAEMILNQFNELSTTPAENFTLKIIPGPRVNDSAYAFMKKLFANRPSQDLNNIKMVLIDKKKKNKQKGAQVDELTKFIESELMKSLVSEVNNRLGFVEDGKLSRETVNELYEFCSFENSTDVTKKSSFCAIFTPKHLKILEYAKDIECYYEVGYGDKLNEDIKNNYGRNLFTHLDWAAKDRERTGITSTFHFGHSTQLVALLVKLGLYKDDEPTVQRYVNQKEAVEKRKWKSSTFSPFGSNIIVVLYRCPENHKVMFYNNEHLMYLSGCQDGVCTMEQLKKKFENEFKNDDGLNSKSEKSVPWWKVFASYTAL